jgi:predicted amidohydrolase YtcJ
MSRARAELVVAGDVLVAALPGNPERAEAVGIAGGRVVSAGTRAEVLAGAAPEHRLIEAGESAVIPGLHDFHIHLVGLARTRMGVLLDDARDGSEVIDRLRAHASSVPSDAWVRGRGWSEGQLGTITTADLDAAVGGRPAFVTSHDGHSAWASAEARRRTGVGDATDDPTGGRIERDDDGRPTGILRETALDLVSSAVPQPQGDQLRPALDATLRDLGGHGITGASEAGDYTAEGGIGEDAALGDSYSTLTDLGDVLDGRLRMTLGIPVDAIAAAAERGLRTGVPLAGRRTMRFGWAKEYADGALGSGTAALFEPGGCGDGGTGILRVTPESLDALFASARRAGIGLAIHAIGDRAAAVVLDAIQRAGGPPDETPADRMEHLQLARAVDRARLVALGVTASIQPIHAAADRDLVESCWDGRQADAYAWRSLLDAGALFAAGSDAPVESVNPWLGVFAAVHRRMPADPRADWRPEQAMSVLEALHAYTVGPARAVGMVDEGHLRIGARADLAVLNVGLDALLGAEVDFEAVRSETTVVDGALVG